MKNDQGSCNIWEVHLRRGSCCHSSGACLVPRVPNPTSKVLFCFVHTKSTKVLVKWLNNVALSATSWTGSCMVFWVSGILPLWRVLIRRALPTLCTSEYLYFWSPSFMILKSSWSSPPLIFLLTCAIIRCHHCQSQSFAVTNHHTIIHCHQCQCQCLCYFFTLFHVWFDQPWFSQRSGMKSLLTLLPLFDSGSGTFYDLRHLTMHTAPKVFVFVLVLECVFVFVLHHLTTCMFCTPHQRFQPNYFINAERKIKECLNIRFLFSQIARWDYHATHINQLLTLATVEEKNASQILRFW